MSRDPAVATFDIESSGRFVDGEWAVYPNALLFRSGSYEDKDFRLTDEEMAAAVADFTPVAGNIEHTQFLSGRACRVRSIRLDPDEPQWLRGEVAVPLWLDENLTDREKRLSCEWNRESKRLSGIGLVINPRIPEASLMASFAAAHPGEAAAAFATPRRLDHEASRTLQWVHDLTASHDGICGAARVAAFGDRPRQIKALRAIHDTSASHGATCPATARFHGPSKGTTMNWTKNLMATLFGERAAEVQVDPTLTDDQARRLVGMLTADGEPAPEPAAGAPPPSPASFAESAEFKAAVTAAVAEGTKAERDKLESLRAEFRTKEIGLAAASFADGEIRAGRSSEAERADLVADFTQAALDDDQAPTTVTFSDAEGKPAQGTRVARLVARHARRPRLALFGHGIAPHDLPPGAHVLPNGGDGYDPEKAAREQNDRYMPSGLRKST